MKLKKKKKKKKKLNNVVKISKPGIYKIASFLLNQIHSFQEGYFFKTDDPGFFDLKFIFRFHFCIHMVCDTVYMMEVDWSCLGDPI